MLADITNTYVEMAASITRFERLIIATPHPLKVGALLSSRLSREQMAQVYLCHCKSNDTWARDHGPITLTDDATGTLTMLDFRFNGWGEKFEWTLDNNITRTLHEDGAFDIVTESETSPHPASLPPVSASRPSSSGEKEGANLTASRPSSSGEMEGGSPHRIAAPAVV